MENKQKVIKKRRRPVYSTSIANRNNFLKKNVIIDLDGKENKEVTIFEKTPRKKDADRIHSFYKY